MSKVTKIEKLTKFMKSAKLIITRIRHITYKIGEIYSKGCREDPWKLRKIAKITKFTKADKFTIIIFAIPFTKLTGKPMENYENCENCKIYDNCEIC